MLVFKNFIARRGVVLKRIRMILAAIAVVALASGCATGADNARAAAPAPRPARTVALVDQASIDDGSGNKVLIQKVEFQLGLSSITVERLAKKYGCEGGTGAGLLTDKGPLEVYRMNCDNGQVFLARCELRQCRSMR